METFMHQGPLANSALTNLVLFSAMSTNNLVNYALILCLMGGQGRWGVDEEGRDARKSE